MKAWRWTVVGGLAVAGIAGTATLAQSQPPAAEKQPVADVKAAAPDARAMAAKAIAYLRSQQDQESGGWSINPKGPTFPAISGLVLTGMLAEPGMKADDATVAAGLKYILSKAQPDGGIYDKVLPNYNTSICLCALAKAPDAPGAKEAIAKAQAFLRTLQFGEGAMAQPALGAESAKPVDKDHAFYGGVGYGRSGRPDLSNTAWMLEGLKASGVASDDPAFQRALVFLQRTQMQEQYEGAKINDMEYAKGSRQGGFIYGTSASRDRIGSGVSEVKNIDETLDDGTTVSKLRAYGSMTYSGFKSYLYAGLSKDDPRVKAAMGWISKNYSVTENPGAGNDGMYYYYVVFARAMQANGSPTVTQTTSDGGTQERRWANDLLTQLATLQNEDGSFRPFKDGARWMEDNKVLITAYALIALEAAGEQARP